MIFNISAAPVAARRLARVLAVLGLALALLMSSARGAHADPAAMETEAQRLVHILGYVSADYGAAVEGGKVVNEDEYVEQLSLLDDAGKMAARMAPSAPADAPNLVEAVRKVRALVEAKADPSAVSGAIEPVRASTIAAFRLADSPSRAPDLARGQALWNEHCTTCHGVTGKGDTARAATLTPRPTNFHDPEVGAALTPYRAANTIRFGVNGTAMVPFTFLSNEDRWDLAFLVVSLRHGETRPADAGVPTYALGELAVRSDAQITADLDSAGVPPPAREAIVADLRRRAVYEDRAAARPLGLARARLDRARVAIARGERDAARGLVIDAYLEGVEPAEVQLRAADPALARLIEERFMTLRGALAAEAPRQQLLDETNAILADITRAEQAIGQGDGRQFLPTALKSGGILLREGVEAALLIAALLALAGQAGLADKKRWVHLGWVTALVLGGITWLASTRLIAISGASRELIEGVTALLAAAVLFYVSYSLLARREVARWMKFLREHVSPRRAALSLFAISLLAAYREAFETVLFYQTLLASDASAVAALVGAAVGAVVLVALVLAWTRAGRFAPPQLFFRVSSWLLYGMCVVFAGQGLAALQMAGKLPIHPLGFRGVPWLGIYPTVETLVVQGLLVAVAIAGWWVSRRREEASAAKPANPATA